jgi:beta-phosphoglucomutase-like phosphatase (HAD superfamily)
VSDLLACPVPADEEAASPKFLRNIKGIIFDFDGTIFDNALIVFYLISAYPPDWLRLWRERLIRKRFAGCDFSSADWYYKAFFDALGDACSRSPDHMRKWYFNRFIPRMINVLRKRYKPRPGTKEFFQRVCGKEKPLPKIAGSTALRPRILWRAKTGGKAVPQHCRRAWRNARRDPRSRRSRGNRRAWGV